MKQTLRTWALMGLATAAASLTSCRITQQTIDFSVFKDAVIPAQNDEVQVEAGSGLSEAAVAAQQATTPAMAPEPTMASEPTPAATTARSYTVVKGDTLSRIARQHRVPLAQLYAANGLSAENTAIREGQVLNIPAASSIPTAPVVNTAALLPAPKRATKGSYTVVTGDTISSIAKRHGISPAALMQANGLTKATADKLSIGQALNIPTKK